MVLWNFYQLLWLIGNITVFCFCWSLMLCCYMLFTGQSRWTFNIWQCWSTLGRFWGQGYAFRRDIPGLQENSAIINSCNKGCSFLKFDKALLPILWSRPLKNMQENVAFKVRMRPMQRWSAWFYSNFVGLWYIFESLFYLVFPFIKSRVYLVVFLYWDLFSSMVLRNIAEAMLNCSTKCTGIIDYIKWFENTLPL